MSILEYLVISERKEAMEDYWCYDKGSRGQSEEASMGQKWSDSSIKMSNTSEQSNRWWEISLDRYKLINEGGMIEIAYDHFATPEWINEYI